MIGLLSFVSRVWLCCTCWFPHSKLKQSISASGVNWDCGQNLPYPVSNWTFEFTFVSRLFFPLGKKNYSPLVIVAFKDWKGQQKEIATNQKIEVVKCVCMCGCFPCSWYGVSSSATLQLWGHFYWLWNFLFRDLTSS